MIPTLLTAPMLRMLDSDAMEDVSCYQCLSIITILICCVVVCEYGELRLVDGTTDLEGRVELCINETWGTVCDGGWSTFDAIVACRQLGYQPAGAVPLYNAAFGAGTGQIWIDDILCNSRESRLIDCPNGGIGTIDFCNGHNDDAGLRCLEGAWLLSDYILGSYEVYIPILFLYRLCEWSSETCWRKCTI